MDLDAPKAPGLSETEAVNKLLCVEIEGAEILFKVVSTGEMTPVELFTVRNKQLAYSFVSSALSLKSARWVCCKLCMR